MSISYLSTPGRKSISLYSTPGKKDYLLAQYTRNPLQNTGRKWGIFPFSVQFSRKHSNWPLPSPRNREKFPCVVSVLLYHCLINIFFNQTQKFYKKNYIKKSFWAAPYKCTVIYMSRVPSLKGLRQIYLQEVYCILPVSSSLPFISKISLAPFISRGCFSGFSENKYILVNTL